MSNMYTVQEVIEGANRLPDVSKCHPGSLYQIPIMRPVDAAADDDDYDPYAPTYVATGCITYVVMADPMTGKRTWGLKL